MRDQNVHSEMKREREQPEFPVVVVKRLYKEYLLGHFLDLVEERSQVQVLIPTMISREKYRTEDPRLKRSDQTHREWLYRQAFHMGRHVIGYEVQKVLAAVDWFESRHAVDGNKASAPIGVAGYGEGALIAFYSLEYLGKQGVGFDYYINECLPPFLPYVDSAASM